LEKYQHTKEELESDFDTVKFTTVEALVNSGLIEKDVADEWCKSHTPIVRKNGVFKSFIRKVTNKSDGKESSVLIG